MTITGDYFKDREQYPGLWGDVYLYIQTKHEEEEIIEKAYAALKPRRGEAEG